MKLNKKGFIATSVLYSLAAIIAVIIFVMIANMKTMRDVNRETSNDIKEELECIDNEGIPIIGFSELEETGYRITKGTDIKLPSEFKCTREVTCTYGESSQPIENTKDLNIGTYTISCTAVSSMLSEKSITKTITITIE